MNKKFIVKFTSHGNLSYLCNLEFHNIYKDHPYREYTHYIDNVGYYDKIDLDKYFNYIIHQKDLDQYKFESIQTL